jgi:hypothetical protein
MKLTELFLAELEREAPRTRRALEQVPSGRDDWAPHPKSMPLGRLAGLVAAMPSWIGLIVNQDELNLTPPEGQGAYQQPATNTLVAVHDGHVQKGREVLARTTDEFLMTTNWKLLAGGESRDGSAAPRRSARHPESLAHHRGQLTVYLRLIGSTVPAIYGPSADDQRFA